jgi:phosphomevalonate kinase
MLENKIITNKTCGKLYIAGEYSILTAGQSAIIKNVNIFMESRISFSDTDEYTVFSDMFDYKLTLEKDTFNNENILQNFDKNYLLICEAIFVMSEYLKLKNLEIKPFEMKITGKMERDGKKFGIGSSGSVVILTIKSILSLYNLEISKEMLFKLSSYVLLKRGDNGSMGDIACISYENLIFYRSFDRKRIRELIEKETLEDVLETDWNYEISELYFNEKEPNRKDKNSLSCEFLAGWTKEPAISKDLINIVKSSICESENFLKDVEEIVKKLREAIKNGDKLAIKECIDENGKLLENLDENIYSKKLKELVNATKNLDICAKSSGAGGGDCGIAFSFDERDTKIVVEKWKKLGIELLYSEKL